jgi:hypothetical protein
MNAKRACLVALVMTLAGVGAARAQVYGSGSPGGPASPSLPTLPAPGAQVAPVDGAPPAPPLPRLSDYILGTKPDCCGPVGGDGPISTEIYARSGPGFIIPTGFLGKTLETGWVIEGGGRALFFNPAGDAACTVDLGLSNVYNHGQHSDRVAVLHVLETGLTGTGRVTAPVTIRDLNRTFANLGVGGEWWLWGPAANCPTCGRMGDGPTCRVGFDAGGRWGTEKMEFNGLQHRTEVIEGAFVAVHADVEVPCGGWVFVGGTRLEWDHTWMHQILQGLPENLQDLNLLVTLGIRY